MTQKQKLQEFINFVKSKGATQATPQVLLMWLKSYFGATEKTTKEYLKDLSKFGLIEQGERGWKIR